MNEVRIKWLNIYKTLSLAFSKCSVSFSCPHHHLYCYRGNICSVFCKVTSTSQLILSVVKFKNKLRIEVLLFLVQRISRNHYLLLSTRSFLLPFYFCLRQKLEQRKRMMNGQRTGALVSLDCMVHGGSQKSKPRPRYLNLFTYTLIKVKPPSALALTKSTEKSGKNVEQNKGKGVSHCWHIVP